MSRIIQYPEMVRHHADATKFTFIIDDHPPENAVLDLDIYRAGRREHPDSHLGWWKFPIRHGHYAASVCLTPDGVLSKIQLVDLTRTPTACVEPLETWVNPDCTCAPNQDLLLILRDENTAVIHTAHVTYIVDDQKFLKRFYEQLHTDDHHANPFLETLHTMKLKRLRRLFLKYLQPGIRILDIGSAYSILSQVGQLPPMHVVCADIGEQLVLKRSRELPDYAWTVSDARQLPFAPGSFNAIFAGEIIEHFPDAEIPGILRLWRNLLAQNGILIITTPNAGRWLNHYNKIRTPFGPDHFREFSLPELEALLQGCRFKVVHRTGVYLELIANYLNRPHARDLLQCRYNRAANTPIIRVLCSLGRLCPRRSLDLIVVASK